MHVDKKETVGYNEVNNIQKQMFLDKNITNKQENDEKS